MCFKFCRNCKNVSKIANKAGYKQAAAQLTAYAARIDEARCLPASTASLIGTAAASSLSNEPGVLAKGITATTAHVFHIPIEGEELEEQATRVVQMGNSLAPFKPLTECKEIVPHGHFIARQDEIESTLKELFVYMEDLIQKHFHTVSDWKSYNEKYPNNKLPYKLLFIFGFPEQFSGKSISYLKGKSGSILTGANLSEDTGRYSAEAVQAVFGKRSAMRVTCWTTTAVNSRD